jgi:hypothetical protein
MRNMRPFTLPCPFWQCSVAVFSPLLVVSAFFLAGRIGRVETHHACLLAVYCVVRN